MACSLGLIGFVVALSMGPDWGWLDAKTLGSGIIGLALLAYWVVLDARRVNGKRFMDLRMLAIPRIRTVSLATFFFGFASISYFGTNGIFLYSNPDKTGYGFALSPLIIAIVLAAASVLSLFSSLLTSKALSLFGERATLVFAGLLLAGGFLVMAAAHGSLAGYCTGFAMFNLSLGMYQAGTRALSVEGVPLEETSTAAGLNELALSVGIAVGAAVVKLISSSSVQSGHISEAGSCRSGLPWPSRPWSPRQLPPATRSAKPRRQLQGSPYESRGSESRLPRNRNARHDLFGRRRALHLRSAGTLGAGNPRPEPRDPRRSRAQRAGVPGRQAG
ncbi:hypothetical protein AHiyo8_32390 [Arthrobacter sp. Hiyo8]|nr:hypothetical protein AHiyo8_32390 [Arthrobacter sp. Hiyo8]